MAVPRETKYGPQLRVTVFAGLSVIFLTWDRGSALKTGFPYRFVGYPIAVLTEGVAMTRAVPNICRGKGSVQ